MNKLTVFFKFEQDEQDPVLRTIIKIDNQPLVNFAYYELAIDLIELQHSLERDGEYFIVTCGCGDPGCAGIRNGIQVTHSAKRISWLYSNPWPDPITQPDLVKKTPSRRAEWIVRGIRLPVRTYVFDRNNYALAIEEGIKQGVQRLKWLGVQKVQIVPEHNAQFLTA